MSVVFKNQTLLTVRLDTHYEDLASATVTQIHYTKPNGKSGVWDATVSGTKVVHTVNLGETPIYGLWKFQSYIEVGGRNAPGEIVEHYFENPLVNA